MPSDKQDVGEHLRATLSGEVTIGSAVRIKQELIASVDKAADLEVLLSEVTEIDTAGIQLLLLAKRHAEQAGKRLRFERPSEPVERLIRLYGLAGIFSSPMTATTHGSAA